MPKNVNIIFGQIPRQCCPLGPEFLGNTKYSFFMKKSYKITLNMNCALDLNFFSRKHPLSKSHQSSTILG